MHRVDSCRLAVQRRGACFAVVAASDAFFPFADGPGSLGAVIASFSRAAGPCDDVMRPKCRSECVSPARDTSTTEL